jgi:hypothetical protein
MDSLNLANRLRPSGRGTGRHRPRLGRGLLTALLGLGAAFGVLSPEGLPPAHGDENMGICIPAVTDPVLPGAGSGSAFSVPAGAAVLFDSGCGDPLGRWETPPAWARHNTTGVADAVEHLATGSYAVRFAGLAAGSGVPLVTAVGAAPDRCRLGGWHPDGFDQVVTVLCADAKGVPVDWEFTASYTTERTAYSVFGYLRADQQSSAQIYQPASQYTSSGVAATVQRTGAGHYTVMRAEPGSAPGADLVSAYGGADGRTFCKVAGSSTTAVSVACFAGAAAVDAQFTLVYGAQGNLLGVPDATQAPGGLPSGYAWSDTAAGPVPDPARRFASGDSGTGWSQSFDAVAHVAHLGMPLPMAAGVPQLVAAGADSSLCAVAGDWSAGSIPVECWDANGTPVRVPADVVFTATH